MIAADAGGKRPHRSPVPSHSDPPLHEGSAFDGLGEFTLMPLLPFAITFRSNQLEISHNTDVFAGLETPWLAGASRWCACGMRPPCTGDITTPTRSRSYRYPCLCASATTPRWLAADCRRKRSLLHRSSQPPDQHPLAQIVPALWEVSSQIVRGKPGLSRHAPSA